MSEIKPAGKNGGLRTRDGALVALAAVVAVVVAFAALHFVAGLIWSVVKVVVILAVVYGVFRLLAGRRHR